LAYRYILIKLIPQKPIMKKLFFFLLVLLLPLGAISVLAKGGGGGHGGGHGGHGGGSHGGHGGGFGHGGHGIGHSSHTGSHTATRSSAERHVSRGPRGGHTIPRGTHNEIPIHHTRSRRYALYAHYWLQFGNYYNPYWVRAIPGYPDVAESDSIYGYVVYNSDTVAGKTFMYENELVIQTNDPTDSIYTFDYTDSSLHCITLFSNGQEMYLVRLKEKDDEFWRIVHAGKLSLYDDNFSFSFIPDDVNFDDGDV
jgi:hypothetical protein